MRTLRATLVAALMLAAAGCTGGYVSGGYGYARTYPYDYYGGYGYAPYRGYSYAPYRYAPYRGHSYAPYRGTTVRPRYYAPPTRGYYHGTPHRYDRGYSAPPGRYGARPYYRR
jgi:hypothetical protein